MRDREIYLCSKKYITKRLLYMMYQPLSTVCCMMTLYMISSCSFVVVVVVV